jgi:hypothetical protein
LYFARDDQDWQQIISARTNPLAIQTTRVFILCDGIQRGKRGIGVKEIERKTSQHI